jgi:hypothetical protein
MRVFRLEFYGRRFSRAIALKIAPYKEGIAPNIADMHDFLILQCSTCIARFFG